jgi:hypothetical protein
MIAPLALFEKLRIELVEEIGELRDVQDCFGGLAHYAISRDVSCPHDQFRRRGARPWFRSAMV